MMLKDRYKRKDHELYMRDKLKNLKQNKDISSYVNDFRIILNQITNISEYDQITYFMQGLIEQTENYVRLRNPDSLQKAIEYAEDYDRFKSSRTSKINDVFMLNKRNKAMKHKNGETEILKIEIEDTVAYISFVITNIMHIEILLGLDWFEQTKAIIDPARRILSIPGKKISLDSKIHEDIDDNIYPSIYNIEDDFVIDDVVNLDFNNKIPNTKNSKLNDLILKNKNVFSLNLNDLGCCNSVKFEIETNSENPIMSQPFRQPLFLIDEMRKEVDKMLKAGIISPGKTGTWASPAFLLKQKSGYRFIVDYRKVNSITKPYFHPLPRVDDILDKLSKGKIFSHLDLRKGYFQISVSDNS
ncbi:unnamed protein product [Brachionus calyciflorus]|uniref:Uncharacterized protein n=1 Tax=Brachionus calyciflorus TaxID=104777 RepID=A0A814NQ35_9BILA|nr:unnamed protein product [Brachionus calyciflorus]